LGVTLQPSSAWGFLRRTLPEAGVSADEKAAGDTDGRDVVIYDHALLLVYMASDYPRWSALSRFMIRIAITQAAFDAIAASMALGSIGYDAEVTAKGEPLDLTGRTLGGQA
jgi:hypothetical protein